MAHLSGRCTCCREAKWTRNPRHHLALPPGTYSRTPTWASREHWLTVALPAAIHRGRDVLRRHHIAPVTLARILAIHARHADDDTGRAVTVAVEHVAAEAGCSDRTVQRARACARDLGIAVEIFRGRHLTLDERLEAWEAGSAQRGYASVYALGVPRWLAPHLPQRLVAPGRARPQPRRAPGERVTPPCGRSFKNSRSRRSRTTSATSADDLASLEASTKQASPDPGRGQSPHDPRRGSSPTGPAQPGSTTRPRPQQRGDRRGPGRSRPRWNPAALRLAEQLRREIPVLRRTGLGRIVPPLTRFAVSPTPWTAEQLVPLIWHVAKVKGWTTDPNRIRRPEAWLAHLLQGIADTEPGDVPDDPRHQRADAAPAEITADDPWADSLLGSSAAAPSPGSASPPGWALLEPAASPVEPTERRDPRRSLWENHERHERETAAEAERTALRTAHHELRVELRGDQLCAHGAGGADQHGRSPRCAHCRYQR